MLSFACRRRLQTNPKIKGTSLLCAGRALKSFMVQFHILRGIFKKKNKKSLTHPVLVVELAQVKVQRVSTDGSPLAR